MDNIRKEMLRQNLGYIADNLHKEGMINDNEFEILDRYVKEIKITPEYIEQYVNSISNTIGLGMTFVGKMLYNNEIKSSLIGENLLEILDKLTFVGESIILLEVVNKMSEADKHSFVRDAINIIIEKLKKEKNNNEINYIL